MDRLQDQPPVWVSDFLSVPFKDRGRARDSGVDCWGGVRLVYLERFRVSLPSHQGYQGFRDAAGVKAAREEEVQSWRLLDGPPAKVGDVGLFRIEGDLLHVGLAVDRSRMLHWQDGVGPSLERWKDPLWLPRLLGWYRYNTVPVTTRQNPLAAPRTIEIPEGATLDQIVEASGLPRTAGLRAFIAGDEVDRGSWGLVRPRAGRVVELAVVPAGGGQGGKTAMRLVLTIAVVVASFYVGPELAAAYVGAGATATATQVAVASALFSMAGTLAINALIPIPGNRLRDNGASKSSPSIAGSQNGINKWGPVPQILGTCRLAPPYGALPYTEVVGDDQYLRCLFTMMGPVDITDLKIGETSLDDLQDVEVEIRNGYPNDDPVRLYPGIVHEDALSIQLTQVSSWHTQTTQTNTDEISVDVTFPQGLAEIQNDGSKTSRSVSIELQYSAAGAGVWVDVNSTSPTVDRGLDVLFRSPGAAFGGTSSIGTTVAWGAGFPNVKPAYLPTTSFSWRADGWIYAPANGTYHFAVDGSDAIDLTVDGHLVVSWYGVHNPVGGNAAAPDYSAHNATIVLTRGWHPIVLRMESRSSNHGAVALGWKKPGDVAYSTVPAANLYRTAGFLGGLRTTWYDTSAFTSSLGYSDSRTEPIRRNLTFAVPRGQYDVRVRRTTADASIDRIIDSVFWTSLRSIRHDDPLPVPGLAKIALRIRATDQLNGVVDQFNLVASSVCKDWDETSGEWVERATNVPASLYRLVMQGNANKRPLADSRLDLDTLQSWAEKTDDLGLTFNGVIDFEGTVYERLRDVAAAGRASYTNRNGLHSVVVDQVQTVPTQHFTPRNSWGFTGRKAFPDLPHALRVRFMNADKGYVEDERIVLDDGYQIDDLDAFGDSHPEYPPATKFEAIELFGVTDPEEVWKHGRYHIAVARLRPEIFEINVDVEHLVSSRGDLVLVTHDVPLLGVGSGRVQGLVWGSAESLVGVTLDEPVFMVAGNTYAIRFRLDNGDTLLKAVTTTPGDPIWRVTFSTPISGPVAGSSQTLRPISDHATTDPLLTSSPFWSEIDETSADDFTTNGWIYDGGVGTPTTMVVDLAHGTAPGAGATGVLTCRYRNDTVSFGPTVPLIEFALYCGATLIGTTGPIVNTGDSTYRTATLALDAAAIASVSDWTNLRASIVAYGVATNSSQNIQQYVTYIDLTVTTPASAGGVKPKVGDLFMFGETGLETREMIIKSIQGGPDLSARVTLVDHAPAVHEADVGAIPPYDSGITTPPGWLDGPEAPVVAYVQSDDYAMVIGPDGSLEQRMLIVLAPQTGTRERGVFIQVRTRLSGSLGPWTNHPSTPAEDHRYSVAGVVAPLTYDVRVRYVAASGRVSPWTDFTHTIVGRILPPPDVASFAVRRLGDGTREYSWDLGTFPPDVAGVLIRYGPGGTGTWGTLTPLHDGILEGSSPQELNVPPAGYWRFAIKMIDTSGNESPNAVVIDAILGPPRIEGVADSDDAFAEGWPGTKTGCFVSNDGTLEAKSTDTWDTLPATWDAYTRWNLHPVSPITYLHPTLDVGFAFHLAPTLYSAGDGDILAEMRWSEDALSWSAWTAAADVPPSVLGRYFDIRATATASVSGPVPRLTALSVVLRARTVHQDIQDLDTSTVPASRRFGPGDIRLPIAAGTFEVVQSVQISFNGTGAGWTWELVDKDVDLGPRIRIWNTVDDAADATIDAVIRGLG